MKLAKALAGRRTKGQRVVILGSRGGIICSVVNSVLLQKYFHFVRSCIKSIRVVKNARGIIFMRGERCPTASAGTLEGRTKLAKAGLHFDILVRTSWKHWRLATLRHTKKLYHIH